MSNPILPGAQFASDNTAGICPEAWEEQARANAGYHTSYGSDAWTQKAADLLRELFETDCEVFFVFNGTAANSLALAACCQSYHSVVCYEHAHICDDECGAPEFFSNGTKLLGTPGVHGKILSASVEEMVSRRSDIHYPKPHVVSLTQSTELGTVYQPSDLQAHREVAGRLGLALHMDGARFANAAAHLGVPPKAITWQAGIDVLCFGGTKLGMSGSEAVIFFNRSMADDFAYRCKQAGQLASKMRFPAAGWVGVLKDGAWVRHASHANRCAALLASGLKAQAGLTPSHPVESNAVFVALPEKTIQTLRAKGWVFYDFIGSGVVRFMCSWQTSEDDVTALVRDIAGAGAQPPVT